MVGSTNATDVKAEVPGSSLDLANDNLDCDLLWFSLVLPGKMRWDVVLN